jgi:hypothetical protein
LSCYTKCIANGEGEALDLSASHILLPTENSTRRGVRLTPEAKLQTFNAQGTVRDEIAMERGRFYGIGEQEEQNNQLIFSLRHVALAENPQGINGNALAEVVKALASSISVS